MYRRRPRRRKQLRVLCVLAGKPEIVPNRFCKEKRFLQHVPDPAPQRAPVDLSELDAVDRYRSSGVIVQAIEKHHQRRLTAARGTEDAYRRSSRYVERDIRQNGGTV